MKALTYLLTVVLALLGLVRPIAAQSASTCTITRLTFPNAPSTPADAPMAFVARGGKHSLTRTATSVRLDTTATPGIRAGLFGNPQLYPDLDRTTGFTLTFGLQVLKEAHNNPNRSGMSVILLGKDKRGIELGFWRDLIWAQEGGAGATLFTQAESIQTAQPQTDTVYTLSVIGEQYTLTANGAPVLTGPVRDYTAFTGFPDVYEVEGFTFFGDNTSGAAASVVISRPSITVCATP
jgi:hypothetical protein